MSVHIKATGKYIPNGVLTNKDFEQIVETSDEWIVTRTGIKKRHKVVEETTVDMAYYAAMDAINKGSIKKEDIDLIIVATITGEQKTPSIANAVQMRLGIETAMSFDINAACTGFIYALEVASALLSTFAYNRALVIGSETLTKIVDYTDRNTCILFGDGAGAAIVERSKDASYFFSQAKPDYNDYLTVKKYIHMDGKRVYIFAVDAMATSIEKVLEKANLTIDDIDAIIPHQANERIVQAVSKNMNIPYERFEMNIAEYGNTSAASIPITLAEYKEKHPDKKRVLLVGFGGGFTYGAAIVNV